MFCLLKVIDGPAQGAQLLLGRNQRVLIGRISTADFPVAADQHMSRNHLVIEGLGETFRVTDAGSSNGTYVNNTPVSSVLLCSGDIIRAGKSLFQVQLRREAAPRSADGVPDPTEEAIDHLPGRTISSLFSAPPGILADKPTEIVGIPQRHQVKSGRAPQEAHIETYENDETTLCTPMEDSQGLLLIRSHFSIDDLGGTLWKQKTQATAEHQLNIFQSVARLSLDVNLIVNRRQIGASAMSLIEFQLAPGELTNLTETLCVVATKRESIFLAICKACVGRDAMVLVAARQPLTPKWIEQSLDAISYPSLLSSIVQESSSRARSLTKNVEFLLFETVANGPLSLLPSNELRDKMHLFKVTSN